MAVDILTGRYRSGIRSRRTGLRGIELTDAHAPSELLSIARAGRYPSHVRYIFQEHRLGCLIASVAMVLDMTYKEVAASVPLQDPQRTGVNTKGRLAIDRVETLALSRGKVLAYLEVAPFECKPGLRYVSLIGKVGALMMHTVAVDEAGVVFDPEVVKEDVRIEGALRCLSVLRGDVAQ